VAGTRLDATLRVRHGSGKILGLDFRVAWGMGTLSFHAGMVRLLRAGVLDDAPDRETAPSFHVFAASAYPDHHDGLTGAIVGSRWFVAVQNLENRWRAAAQSRLEAANFILLAGGRVEGSGSLLGTLQDARQDGDKDFRGPDKAMGGLLLGIPSGRNRLAVLARAGMFFRPWPDWGVLMRMDAQLQWQATILKGTIYWVAGDPAAAGVQAPVGDALARFVLEGGTKWQGWDLAWQARATTISDNGINDFRGVQLPSAGEYHFSFIDVYRADLLKVDAMLMMHKTERAAPSSSMFPVFRAHVQSTFLRDSRFSDLRARLRAGTRLVMYPSPLRRQYLDLYLSADAQWSGAVSSGSTDAQVEGEAELEAVMSEDPDAASQPTLINSSIASAGIPSSLAPSSLLLRDSSISLDAAWHTEGLSVSSIIGFDQSEGSSEARMRAGFAFSCESASKGYRIRVTANLMPAIRLGVHTILKF
ncbi:MAG: hypothetical protein QHH01_03035, partial [Spirochaetales bacterium]|nr:hypothetical protein [Spirochaetales bacterium]